MYGLGNERWHYTYIYIIYKLYIYKKVYLVLGTCGGKHKGKH